MNISIPHFIFGSLIAGLIGAVIHLVLGGKLLRIFFAIIFSWIGFWTGHSIANRIGMVIFRLGVINIGVGVIISILFGLFGHWVAGENKNRKEV